MARCPFSQKDLDAPRGSTWRKIDLHVHTPGSTDYAGRCREGTPRQQAERIVDDCKDMGVELVALTDHNSATYVLDKDGKAQTGQPTIYEYARARGEKRGVVVLPASEVTAQSIHTLVILEPSPIPANDATRVGSLLLSLGLDPSILGNATEACVETSIGDVLDAARDWGGIAVPAHVDAKSGFLAEEGGNRLRRLILSKPDLYAVECVNDATTREWLAKVQGLAKKRGGLPIACIQSSDCHFVPPPNLTSAKARLKWKTAKSGPKRGNGRPIGLKGNYTWAKMDEPSFSALRTALQDPDNRIRLSETDFGLPEAAGVRRPGQTYIEAVRMRYDEKGKEETLHFSPGATAIVGPPGTATRRRMEALDLAVGALGEGEGPAWVQSADVLLSCAAQSGQTTYYWLHWDAASPGNVTAASGSALGKLSKPQGYRVVTRGPERTKYQLAQNLGIAIPQTFRLEELAETTLSLSLTLRLVEWHLAHELGVGALGRIRTLHQGLVAACTAPTVTGVKRALTQLHNFRTKLVAKLNQMAWDTDAGEAPLKFKLQAGTWKNTKMLEKAVAAMAAAKQDVAASKAAFWPLEDGLIVSAPLIDDSAGKPGRSAETEGKPTRRTFGLHKLERGHRLMVALQILLHSATAGPLVIDAPEDLFRPDRISDCAAPMLIAAKERGRQIIASSRDPVLCLAIDAEQFYVYEGSPDAAVIAVAASGGCDKDLVRRALIDAFEGNWRLARMKQVKLGEAQFGPTQT
ncbi:MAG: hypothetical protein FJX75_07245 [Armatimonadetes bacterium]|nr:hypothetical protein [Armatimonadota bacterium]